MPAEYKEEEKADEEELVDTILDAIGEYSKKHSPISPKCQMVIDEGPVCRDGYTVFTEQRRFAMCKAFDLLETGEVDSLSEGLTEAWKEIHTACALDEVGAKKKEAKEEEEEEKKIPSYEVYYPSEKCDLRSFRTETFAKPGDELPEHRVRLLYCCPRGQWDEETGRCKTAVKLHSLFREAVG
jgi:hypothetical protein